MPVYTGPRRRVRLEELAAMQARGFVAEEKLDGWYVTLTIGTLPRLGTSPGRIDGGYDRRFWRGARRPGVVTSMVTRGGRAAPAGDVLHRQTPWPDGTVLVGELMTSTPAARLWQERHGCTGVVLFDALAVGGEDWTWMPQAARREQLERMVDGLSGRDRAVFQLPRRSHRIAELARSVIDEGGEGVVVIDPQARAGAGRWKAKRTDTVTCTVLRPLPAEGVVEVMLGSAGQRFAVSLPRFDVRPGQLVDVACMGTYESGEPRHARITRERQDLET
jgi:hypothetical protein